MASAATQPAASAETAEPGGVCRAAAWNYGCSAPTVRRSATDRDLLPVRMVVLVEVLVLLSTPTIGELHDGLAVHANHALATYRDRVTLRKVIIRRPDARSEYRHVTGPGDGMPCAEPEGDEPDPTLVTCARRRPRSAWEWNFANCWTDSSRWPTRR